MASDLRDAATVLTLRDGTSNGSFEVFLVRRHGGSGFMAGAHVFPGGVVDEGDSDPRLLDHAEGRTPAECAACLGEPGNPKAAAYFFAAMRETFEEAGVLVGTSDAPPDDHARSALQNAERTFGDVAVQFGLKLRLDALVPQARWITPTVEKRRYDTRFFLARSPAGQIARHDDIETTAGDWFEPRAALEAEGRGEIKLPPPTLVSLEWLAGFDDIDGAMQGAAARTPPVIQPEPQAEGSRIVLALPGDPLHSLAEPAFEHTTRVVLENGRWWSKKT